MPSGPAHLQSHGKFGHSPHETTRCAGDRRLPAPVAPPPARDRSRPTHRLTCAPLRQFTPDGAEAAIGVDPVQRPRVVAGERRLGQHSDDALFRQPTARGTHAAGAGYLDPGARPVTLLWLLTSPRGRGEANQRSRGAHPGGAV